MPALASRDQLFAKGKSLRQTCPRGSHAAWSPPPDRLDPVQLIRQANEGRIPTLVPIRHGRMLQSPFTFYRGTALNMAADLAATPATGIRVQVCGDAHLGNFRCFATPERRVIFDINDLDETLPGPWEWDVKRVAASFIAASRSAGIRDRDGQEAVQRCVNAYRESMSTFSQMHALDVWHSAVVVDAEIEKMGDKSHKKQLKSALAKARKRDALEHDFPELAHAEHNRPVITENPPTIYHWPSNPEKFMAVARDAFVNYRRSLPPERRVLLDRFDLMDVAVKVVGVGSVGTYCFVLLLQAGDKDHLFLQAKQARASVLEAFAGASAFRTHGQRVVVGHRLMQSASDMFLGWTQATTGEHYYFRQLRDVKIKFKVDTLNRPTHEALEQCT